jgi:cysteine synthase A
MPKLRLGQTFLHPTCNITIFELSGMPDSTKNYILGAFLLGVTLSTAWSAHKYNQRRVQPRHSKDEREPSESELKQHRKRILQISRIKDPQLLKKALADLEDSFNKGVIDIKEGIEGCIGDTPLIKIKSLSEATGCEILAKAEVLFLGMRRCEQH